MSIKTKLILILLTATILPVTIVSQLIFKSSSRSIESKLIDQVVSFHDQKTNSVTEHLVFFKSKLSIMVNTPTFRALKVKGLESVDSYQAVEQLMKIYHRQIPELDQVRILDLTGKELIKVIKKKGKALTLPENKLQNKAHRSYFREAIQVGHDEIYTSKLDLNMENRAIEIPHRPTLRISKKIRKPDGTPFGIILLNIDMTSFFKQLAKTRFGEMILVDQDGDVLMANDSSTLFGSQLKTNYNFFDNFPEFLMTIQEKDGKTYQTHTETEYRVWKKIYYDSRSKDRFFVLIDRIKNEEIFADISELKNYVTYITATLCIISIFLSVFLSNSIARPIQKLTAMAIEVSKGNFNVDLSESPSKEIEDDDDNDNDNDNELSTLSFAMSKMITKIKTMIKDLENSNAKEQELREFSNTVIENSPNGLLLVDDKGLMKLVNSSASSLFGYTKEELEGKPVEILLPKDLRREHVGIREEYQKSPSKKAMGVGRDLYGKRKNDTLFPVEIGLTPIKTKDEGSYTLAAINDITFRKKSEDIIKKSNEDLLHSNKELAEFSYIVSHDLKAPLRGIGSLAEWLYEDYGDKLKDEGKKHLQMLKSRALRMNELIDGILRYSKIGNREIKKELVNTNELVKQCIDILDVPENIHIKAIKPLPNIFGSVVQFEQLFQNLLSNAIKYNDKDIGIIAIDFEELKECYHFKVIDNGQGIEEEYSEQVFKIFNTLSPRDKVESTGIGLTIVKKIIERHEGKVWIESKKGKGTTVHFKIPKRAKGRRL